MYGKGKKCVDVDDYDAQSAKIDKERKLLNIKQIKEGIKKEKARGFGIHLSASNIYDYSLSNKNNINNNHACLPIWYNQENSVTISVVDEIRSCFKK
jgi:hypothetical protein